MMVVIYHEKRFKPFYGFVAKKLKLKTYFKGSNEACEKFSKRANISWSLIQKVTTK